MSLFQDLRFAVRLLVKDRWFTAVAIVALALGIGVNATVFTFVNAVLLRGPHTPATTFRLTGQRPLLGRDFLPDDDKPGAPAVTILGNSIWKTRYGGDPAILGRTIRINDVPTTVVGVMPEGMKFPFGADLWIPLAQ